MTTSVGGGSTFAINDNIYAFGLSSIEGAYGEFIPNNYWIGAGFSAGLLALYEKIGIKTEIKQTFATSSIGTNLQFETKINYYLNQNTSIEAMVSYQNNKSKNISENILSLKRYF